MESILIASAIKFRWSQGNSASDPGGSSFLGVGARALNNTIAQTGITATSPGGGGGGALGTNASGASGGAGAPGCVLITEFIRPSFKVKTTAFRRLAFS